MKQINEIAAAVLLGLAACWACIGQQAPLPILTAAESPATAQPATKNPAPFTPPAPLVLDERPSTGSGVESPPLVIPPEPTFDPRPFVHRMTIGNAHGSCVAIGNRRFVTCWHVVVSGGRQAVKIDGAWARGQWRYDAAHDVAVFTSTDRDLPGCQISAEWSQHLSPAVAIGLPGISDEKRAHSGFIADADALAVSNDQPEIEQGESGGGVFVEGKLVGILRGHAGGGTDAPPNPRAGKFTPLAQVAALFDVPQAPQTSAAQAQPQTAGRWVKRCYGSYCRMEWEPAR